VLAKMKGAGVPCARIGTTGGDAIAVAGEAAVSVDALKSAFERWLSPDNFDAEGRQKRKPFIEPPDLLSLSQILRLAGNYVDRMRGRLLRVSWQDQSDKIQAITVQWQAQSTAEAGAEALAIVEEVCMHIYKQRKKMPLVTERQAHRPFVSVARGS